MGGVVDEDIDASEFRNSLVDDRAAMRGRSDIARHQHRFAAGFFHESPRLLRILVFVEIRNQDIRAFAREGNGDSPSNATIRARDYGPLSGELAGAAVALLAVIR